LWHLSFPALLRGKSGYRVGHTEDIHKGKNPMTVHCSTRASSISVGLLLVLAAIPASAHHSAAPFDLTKSLTLQGTVEKWVWANPHSWLYIRVVKADGSQEVWGLESGSTGMLARAGWNAADMKPGDKVTVKVAPERTGNHIGLLNEVQLANGQVLKGGGVPPAPGGAGAPPPGDTGNAPPPASR
jgi:hypothetical protein